MNIKNWRELPWLQAIEELYENWSTKNISDIANVKLYSKIIGETLYVKKQVNEVACMFVYKKDDFARDK